MSWSDPIVDEVRRTRDAYAARFNYDLRAIFRDLKEQEKRSGQKVVSYAEIAQTHQALQPTGGDVLVPEGSKVAETAPAAEL